MSAQGGAVLVLGAYGQVGRVVVEALRGRTALPILAAGGTKLVSKRSSRKETSVCGRTGSISRMASRSGEHAPRLPCARSEDEGAAALLSALFELGHDFEELREGRLSPTRAGEPVIRRVLPDPFGATRLVAWPQLEILVAARADGVEQMRTGIVLAGLRPLPAAALRVLRWLDPERRPKVRSLLRNPFRWLHRRAYRSAEARRLGTAALVAVELAAGGVLRRTSFAVPDGALATAWLPVLLAERASELPGGVASPMDLIHRDAVMTWLRAYGDAFELRRDEPAQEAP